jgi:hypothetical protein
LCAVLHCELRRALYSLFVEERGIVQNSEPVYACFIDVAVGLMMLFFVSRKPQAHASFSFISLALVLLATIYDDMMYDVILYNNIHVSTFCYVYNYDYSYIICTLYIHDIYYTLYKYIYGTKC